MKNSTGDIETLDLKQIGEIQASARLSDLTWSKNGNNLALAGADAAIQIWDIDNKAKIKQLVGHQATVMSIDWSPGPRLIASGGQDRTVRIWDVTNGSEARRLEGHSDWVSCVTWHPHQGILISASRDSSIRVWNAGNGRCQQVLDHGLYSWPMDLAISRDGKRLASASTDGNVRVWSTADWQESFSLQIDNVVCSVTWGPDNRSIAAGLRNGTIVVIDSATGEPTNHFTGNGDDTWNLIWSSSPSLLVSASLAGAIKLWDPLNGNQEQSIPSDGPVAAVGLRPGRFQIAAACEDGSVPLWGLESLDRLPESASAEGSGHSFLDVPMLSQTEKATVLTQDTSLDVMEHQREAIRTFRKAEADREQSESEIKSQAQKAHDQRRKGSRKLGEVGLYSLLDDVSSTIPLPKTSQESARTRLEKSVKVARQAVARIEEGVNKLARFRARRRNRRVVAAVVTIIICGALVIAYRPLWVLLHYQIADQAVQSGDWDRAAEEILKISQYRSSENYNLPYLIEEYPSLRLAIQSQMGTDWNQGELQRRAVLSGGGWEGEIAFSPDSQRVAVSSYRNVRLWDAHSTQRMLDFRVHLSVEDLAFSSDSRTLAIATCAVTRDMRVWSGSSSYNRSYCAEAAVQLYDVNTGADTVLLSGSNSDIELMSATSVAFHPLQPIVVAGGCAEIDQEAHCSKGGVVIWHAGSGREINSWTYGEDPVRELSFDAEGETLSGLVGSTMVLWYANNGVVTHSQDAREVGYDPGGLLYAASDQTITVNDFSGTVVHTLPNISHVESMAINPGGQVIAIGRDNTIEIWNIPNEELLHSQKVEYLDLVVFSPDGRFLATSDGDDGAVLWWVTKPE